jgi:hypothetical protein
VVGKGIIAHIRHLHKNGPDVPAHTASWIKCLQGGCGSTKEGLPPLHTCGKESGFRTKAARRAHWERLDERTAISTLEMSRTICI